MIGRVVVINAAVGMWLCASLGAAVYEPWLGGPAVIVFGALAYFWARYVLKRAATKAARS